jgi:hypothetical protein
MPLDQCEDRSRPSDDGLDPVAPVGRLVLTEYVEVHEEAVDHEGTQDVLECFQGLRLEVRRDLARLLAETPAGPALATLVESLDLGLLDAHDRVEVVAAAGRVASWAHAMKARAAAAVDRHWTMSTPRTEPVPDGMHVVPERIAPATLALRLQASPRETATLIVEGRCYDGVLAETGDALARGAIDPPRARVIARRLHDQPARVALQVEAEVLERAEGRTSYQVKQDVERALLRVDAEHASDRHVAARATRCVSRPQVRDDGMAALWVLLPAVEAVRVDGVLEAAARAARAAGDPRTLEQLRADGLCDLVLNRGCTPTDAFGRVADGGRPADGTRPADGGLPVDGTHPADDGRPTDGTRPADDGHRADDGRPAHEGPGTNPDARALTAAPNAPGPERGTPTTESDPRSARADGRSVRAPHTGTGAVTGFVDAPGPETSARTAAPRSHPRTRVLITIPITTMMGLDDGPAELAGYGPVDAVQARALAWGGTWQRMLTDPRDGTLLELGRTRYRPTAALAEHVRRRDRTCVWPGCPLPADLADLDHSRDFHRPPDDGGPPGTTSHENLAPLCRNHHRLKSEADFTLHHFSPGTYVWTDPTGHRYEVQPGTDRATVPLPAVPAPF